MEKKRFVFIKWRLIGTRKYTDSMMVDGTTPEGLEALKKQVEIIVSIGYEFRARNI